MWDGKLIQDLSHGELCDIIMELVTERDEQRRRDYERMSKLFPVAPFYEPVTLCIPKPNDHKE